MSISNSKKVGVLCRPEDIVGTTPIAYKIKTTKKTQQQQCHHGIKIHD